MLYWYFRKCNKKNRAHSQFVPRDVDAFPGGLVGTSLCSTEIFPELCTATESFTLIPPALHRGWGFFTIYAQHSFSKATYQNADEPELSFVTLHKPRGMDAQGSVGNKEGGTCGKREDCQEHQGWKEVSRTKNTYTHNRNHIFLSGVTMP